MDRPTDTAPPGRAAGGDGEVGTRFERNLILWLTNVSHAVNHFQNSMVSVLYVPIMSDLGLNYFHLGLLTAVRNLLNSGTQGLYGFLAPFLRRTYILAFGNMVLGTGVMLSGFANSFFTFVVARGVSATGSSAQHPIGSSLLAGYFPKNRGTILALNSSISGVGSFVAPLLAAYLLYVVGWRQVFHLVAGLSILVGLAYLFLGKRVTSTESASRGKRGALAQGMANYKRVLGNRNILIVAMVMMVGAAGRGGGVNDTYLIPHFVNDLGLTLTMAAWVKMAQQVGGMAGPLAFGWISDRVSRKRVIQVSLLLSAVGTWWIASQGPSLPMLFVSFGVYGVFTHSRMTLTQALVADSVADDELDAAFSVFYFLGFISVPIWGPLTGYMMQNLGFPTAFSVLGFSYLAGMVLMFLVVDPRSSVPASQAGGGRRRSRGGGEG